MSYVTLIAVKSWEMLSFNEAVVREAVLNAVSMMEEFGLVL